MEKVIRVKIEGEVLPVNTTLPSEDCRSCSMVTGELGIVIKALTNRRTLENPPTAYVTCHQLGKPKPNSCFMDITLVTDEESINAGDIVRNWNRRRVHCGIK